MSYKAKITEMRGELRVMNKLIPQVMADFADLSKTVKESPAISVKEKEYVALGDRDFAALRALHQLSRRGADEGRRQPRGIGRGAGNVHPDGRRPGGDVCGPCAGRLG